MSPTTFVGDTSFTTFKMKPQNFHFRLKLFVSENVWYTLLMQEDVIKCFWCYVNSLVRERNESNEHVVEMKLQCLLFCCFISSRLKVAIIKCQLEWIALFMYVEVFSLSLSLTGLILTTYVVEWKFSSEFSIRSWKNGYAWIEKLKCNVRRWYSLITDKSRFNDLIWQGYTPGKKHEFFSMSFSSAFIYFHFSLWLKTCESSGLVFLVTLVFNKLKNFAIAVFSSACIHWTELETGNSISYFKNL